MAMTPEKKMKKKVDEVLKEVQVCGSSPRKRASTGAPVSLTGWVSCPMGA
jgi:hypothetical protein